MIYDCFSFFNELDILEIRLKTLFDLVDYFVIAESRYTHAGVQKPLYFKENEKRFAPFLNKIIHVVSPDPLTPERAKADVLYRWEIENVQRNSTVTGIQSRLSDDDTLIISDVDEIPSPDAVQKAIGLGRPCRLKQRLYYYFLNYRCCTTPYWLSGTVVLTVRAFKSEHTYRAISEGDALVPSVNVGPTATKVRALRKIKLVPDGGWHFSYMGGIPIILTKLNSIADGLHRPITESAVRKCIETGNDPYDRGEWYFAEPIDKHFPIDLSVYPHMLFDITPEYLKRVRFQRWLAYAKGVMRPWAWKLLPNDLVLKVSKLLNAWQFKR